MSTPVRRLGMSRPHRSALALVSAGTVIGLAAALVTAWPAWIALAALIAAAWGAYVVSRREVREARVEAHDSLMLATDRAYESLVAERTTSDKVMVVLRDRNSALTSALVEARAVVLARKADLAQRHMEISRLRGDNESLRHEVSALVERVDSLQGRLAVLVGADGTAEGAEILSLPRRPMKHQRMLWSDDDVWGDDEMPSVVDLVRADAAISTVAVEARREA